MTLQDLGSIGDLVAGIATIATLVYLAIQIRQSRSSIISANVQAAIQSFNPINTAVGSDPVVAELVNRGVSDFDSLNKVERAQYQYLQRAFLNCFWNLHEQHKLGALSTEQWLPYAHQVAFLATQPGPAAFRRTNPQFEELFEAVQAMNLPADHLDLNLGGPADGGGPAAQQPS